MKITSREVFYKQSRLIFTRYNEVENEYKTNKYNYRDPVTAMDNLLYDFSKSHIVQSNNVVSVIQLYINDILVAQIEPSQTYEDCKVNKHLRVFSYNTMLNTLHKDFLETFSE